MPILKGQGMSSFEEIAKKIRTLPSNKIRINVSHIEIDHAHREINRVDIQPVLKSGKVVLLGDDQRIEWQGKDDQGREIKLICRLRSVDGIDTLDVLEADTLYVGSASRSGALKGKAADRKLREDWLKENPGWQINAKDYLERKK